MRPLAVFLVACVLLALSHQVAAAFEGEAHHDVDCPICLFLSTAFILPALTVLGTCMVARSIGSCFGPVALPVDLRWSPRSLRGPPTH